jgi:cobalt-zinc-cadmium resistance protein CzcA
MKKKELVMAVKSAYYYWIYQNNRVKLLSDKQKVFSGLNAFAEMKYDSGLISPEEKTGIESAASEAAMQLASAIADMEISANNLRMYIMSNNDLEPSLQNLPLYQVERASDTMTYSGRTLINYYRAVLDASSESVRLKKSSFFPDISAGIINQQIGSFKGLWAWQVGISLALPPVSEAAEVEQARIDEKIASNDLENRIFVTEKEIENLLIELEKTFGSIMYFDRYSLVQAEQAEENAKTGLDRGEISYYDYAKKIAESNEIKLIYLETVNRYNQLAIQLEFYMD